MLCQELLLRQVLHTAVPSASSLYSTYTAVTYGVWPLTTLLSSPGRRAKGPISCHRQVWLQLQSAHLRHSQLQLAGALLNSGTSVSTAAVHTGQLENACACKETQLNINTPNQQEGRPKKSCCRRQASGYYINATTLTLAAFQEPISHGIRRSQAITSHRHGWGATYLGHTAAPELQTRVSKRPTRSSCCAPWCSTTSGLVCLLLLLYRFEAGKKASC